MLDRLFSAERLAPVLRPRETASGVIRQFEVEAKNSGAKFIEAEHMLLALTTNSSDGAGRLLNEWGLNHERLASALQAERRQSLAFAGVEQGQEVAATELDRRLSLGTSAKAALKRALVASRRERRRRPGLHSTDLLVGILEADLGTVPRALAIAGIDRSALISRTRAGAD